MKNGCLTPKEQLTMGGQLLIPWRQRDTHVAVDSIRAVGGRGQLGWVSIICEVKVTSLSGLRFPVCGMSGRLWKVLLVNRASLVQRLNS